MNRRTVAVDVGIAVLAAGLVLILSAGVAIAGLIAIVVLVGCGISLVLERRGRPSRRRIVGRRGPRRR